MLIKANFPQNDHDQQPVKAPADLLLVSSTPQKVDNVEVFYFYSHEQKKLYRQIGANSPSLNTEQFAQPMDIPNLVNVLNVSDGIFAITDDGLVRKVEASGALTLSVISERWLAQHNQWWSDLNTLHASPDQPINILGIKNASNQENLLAFYYKNRVVLISDELKDDSLEFLDINENTLRLFDRKNGKLYQQTLIDPAEVATTFGQSGHIMKAHPSVFAMSPLFPDHQFSSASIAEKKLRLTTNAGEILVADTPSNTLHLVGINLSKQENVSPTRLRTLSENWACNETLIGNVSN